ncbi:MAG: OsmC family protein [Gemmatimonadetes bacterium]|nr:OsmC family protein [Gemmatimonadota bacterium]
MPSIENSGFPLVFRVADDPAAVPARPSGPPEGVISLRTEVRAFEGMQKEAVVTLDSGARWRMVSDEGPYLNGTDLAPFPLAFFAAGMQFSFISQLLQGARAQSIGLEGVALAQDNFYTMEGSFLRGDAVGGALPTRLEVILESDADPEVIRRLVRMTEASSGAQALLRTAMTNVFTLTHNGEACTVEGVEASASARQDEPLFVGITPDAERPAAVGLISKVSEAETVHGVEGGAGSSLQAEQKRTLHVHGDAVAGQGMAMETDIRLFKPIGSSFRFRCDEVSALGGDESAPPPLAYTAAGVGFCYMTQLGRYAHILGKELGGYSLVQDMSFRFAGEIGAGTLEVTADPVDTHVFLHTSESDDLARDFIRTGARTCFLHAAMGGSHRSEIGVSLNGAELAV